MKKRLEAELISIAHRILKLKNRSEVDQLYKETQKLYETLTILKFYQDNYESVKSEVSKEDLEEKLEQSKVETVPEKVADVIAVHAEVQPELSAGEHVEKIDSEIDNDAVQPEFDDEIEEASAEETMVSNEPEEENEEILKEESTLEEEEEVATEKRLTFEPIFELEDVATEEFKSEHQPEEKLEDHIGKYADPVFVKPNEVSLFPGEIKEEEPKREEPKFAALNDSHSKSIAIGLNDRIGFVQHLFNDSNEDFNRVISQLNTFDTFEEAKNFINEMVIPDYNYWIGEEDYIERFMAIVEKKFE